MDLSLVPQEAQEGKGEEKPYPDVAEEEKPCGVYVMRRFTRSWRRKVGMPMMASMRK
jgi:hypothetical protein